MPLVWLSYSMIDHSYERIQITQNQRQGVILLRMVNQVIQAAERYRDVKVVTAYQFEKDDGGISNQYKNAFYDAFIALGDYKADFLADNDYQQIIRDIESSAKAMEHVKVNQTNSAESTFNQLNKVVQNGRLLTKIIRNLSGLTQDSNPENQILIDFASKDLTPISELLGQLRSIGSYSLTQSYLSSIVADELDSVSGKLYEVQPQYEKAIELTIPTEQQELKEMSILLSNSIANVLSFTDEKIMAALELHTSWQTYYSEVSKTIDIQYRLADEIFTEVDSDYVSALEEQTHKLKLITSVILCALLLTSYLYASLYFSLRLSIQHLLEATSRMAKGDMTVSLKVYTKDELGHLTHQFNQTADRIRKLITEVHGTAKSVYHQSQEVSRITEKSGKYISRQMQDTELAASAMTEMSSNFSEVADFSSQAENAAQEASMEASHGREQVNKTLKNITSLAAEIQNTVAVIDRLADDTINISQVLVQIKGIAEQTNLLALNAAIESARAGEHGRGFAVVADEVRSLSSRTHQSAEEIEEMINKIRNGVSNAVSAMSNCHNMTKDTVSESEKVGSSLEEINQKVTTILEMNTQIAEAVKQQAIAAEDIDQSIVGINRVAENNVESAKETTGASEEMSSKVSDLQQTLASFTV